MNVSVNMAHTTLKFETRVLGIQMKGSVSQNVDLGLSFNSIKCRNLDWKK